MPKEPVLFNRLEDSNLKSVLGPDGTEVGASVTYPSVKFGNGIYSASAGEGALWGLSSFNAGTAFTIDFWAMVTRYSRPEPLIGGGGATDSYCPVVWFYHVGNVGANSLQFLVYPYTLAASRYAYLRFDYAFTNGVPFHVNISCDAAGGALHTDKMKVRINGTLITSFTSSVDNTLASDWTSMNNFHSMAVGYNVNIPSWFGEAVDNIKVYDYINHDTDVREDERGGLNDQAIII
jgi:hypothetical protein